MRFVELATVILYQYPCVALQRFMRFVELASIVILYLYPSVAMVYEIC